MKNKIFILALSLWTASAAHAQTAIDVETQIKVTHDVVGQIIRDIQEVSANPSTIDVSDYLKWKTEFSQRVLVQLQKFEQKVNDQLLPEIRTAAQPLQSVRGITGLSDQQKDVLILQEKTKFESQAVHFSSVHKQAIRDLLTEVFGNLPAIVNYDYRRHVSYFDFKMNEISKVGTSKPEELQKARFDFDSASLAYGYQKMIYPYIRQYCETRSCVTFVTQTLMNTVTVLLRDIDQVRSVSVAGETVLLDKYFYAVNPSVQFSNSAIGFYSVVLKNPGLLPDEYETLPLSLKP